MIYSLLFLASLTALYLSSLSQTLCSGSLTGTFPDILISGGACTLDSAIVTGSITIQSGGSLITLGSTMILGSVTADSSGDILLSGSTTVNGELSSSNSPSSTITVDTTTTLDSVSLLNSGSIVIKGTVNSVSSNFSGDILVDGGAIGGGGIGVSQGAGDISLCSATVAGEVKLSQNNGDLIASTTGGCTESQITGSVSVEKGTGDVDLNGARIESGDVLVVEQTGNVQISNSIISDITVTKLMGAITVTNTDADSDATISDVSGVVKIVGSRFEGDVSITSSAGAEVLNTDFGLEVVAIEGNSGPVLFNDNTNFSVILTENDDVTVNNNMGRVASVTKNTGGVSITGNTFTELSCVDNTPSPTGAGNTVTILASGQCSSF